MNEKTIYTGTFYTLMHLQVELANAFEAAKAARYAQDSTNLDEDEVSCDSNDTVTMTEEKLSDGSIVYNLRLS